MDWISVDERMPEEGWDVLVPNCVYRCGCPEERPCKTWAAFAAWMERKYGFSPGGLTIQMRYDLYNEYFYEMRKGEWK